MNKDTGYGILLITVMSVAAWFMAMIPAVKALSLSSLIMGIVLGMIFANTYRSRVPEAWEPGLKFCSKRMLRLGIILYGFRLTFQDVVAVGVSAVVVDATIVTVTILLGLWLGRMIRLDRDSTLLTSTGSAICGAAAVLGAEPIVRASQHKAAIAVSTVVIFGTISMFLYPIAYRAGLFDGFTTQQIGIYTGATLHEVAHVVGAGNAMGEEIATSALIVKMVRVMMLVPVLLIMSYCLALEAARRGMATAAEEGSTAEAGGKKKKIIVPWFAFLFLLMICVNSFLHACCGGQVWLSAALKTIEFISTFMLTMAMTALGCDTSIAKFRQAGARPFVLASLLYVWLVVGGYLLTRFIVPVLG